MYLVFFAPRIFKHVHKTTKKTKKPEQPERPLKSFLCQIKSWYFLHCTKGLFSSATTSSTSTITHLRVVVLHVKRSQSKSQDWHYTLLCICIYTASLILENALSKRHYTGEKRIKADIREGIQFKTFERRWGFITCAALCSNSKSTIQIWEKYYQKKLGG